MASAAPGTRGVSDQTAARALLTPKRTVGPRAGAAESPGRTMLTPRRLPPRSAVAGAASASGTNAASLQSPARALFTLKRPPPRPVVAGASAATPTSSSQLPPRRLPPRPVVAGMPSQLPPHRLPARPTVPSRALSNPSQSPARALLTPRRVLSTTNLSEPVGRNPTLTNPNMCAAPTSTGRLCENPNLEPFGRCPPHASPKRLAPRPAAVPASEFANNNPALMNPNMCAAPTEEGVLCENPNFARFGRCPLHSSLRNAGTDEVEEGKREPTTFFEQSLLAAAGGPVSGPTAGTNNVASVENAVGNATMKNTGADRSGGHAGPTAQHSVTPPGGKRKLSDSHAVAPAAADADGDDSFRTLARAGLKRPRRTSEAGADDNGGENVELDGDVDTTPNGTVQTATGGALRRMVGRVLGFWKSEDEVANDG